ARFGDPETQVLLDRLETPLGGLLMACATGELGLDPVFKDGAAVTVVVSAENYPDKPVRGDVITGLVETENAYVIHAGTGRGPGGEIVSDGGRVLNVVGHGPDQESARRNAYDLVERVKFRGSHYRTDIAR
ncbi:MAG: phosphoribosylamine--glycine ligase, partial [Nonomuraea sp.]|nr:phosphoribosylamine--glycine ligase [Nonomuraea sp.]